MMILAIISLTNSKKITTLAHLTLDFLPVYMAVMVLVLPPRLKTLHPQKKA
jgi:hypothetical protein